MSSNFNADNPRLVMDLQLFNEGTVTNQPVGTSGEGAAAGAPQGQAPEGTQQGVALTGDGQIEIPPNTDPRKVLPNPLRQDWASVKAQILQRQQQQGVITQPQVQQGTELQDQGEQNLEKQDDQTGEKALDEGLLEQIPEKFKLPDGSINVNALMKSYLGMEKVLGKQGQELGQMAELKKQIEELRSMIGQPQQGQDQPPAQNEGQQQALPQPQLSQEEIEKLNEEWMQKWYDNPTMAIAELVYPLAQNIAQQITASQLQPLQPIIERLMEEEQVNQLTQRFEPLREQNPEEFAELLPTMQEIVDELGDSIGSIPNAERVIYDLAKARYAQVNKPKTLEELLADPANRQKVLQDESIRQEILKVHAQQIKQGQPPVVISSQPGIPPATPPAEIKSIKDGTNALRAWLSRLGGNA